MSDSGDGASSRQRGVRVLGLGFAGLLALLIVGVLVAYYALDGEPEHWTQQRERINALSETQRKTISQNMRNRLLTEWNGIGSEIPTTEEEMFGQRRTLEIPYEDLNVWLAEEGIDLLGEVGIKMPSWVKAAMVDSPGDGLLRISCEVDKDKVQQVVTLTFSIKVREDHKVVSKLEGATAGVLPIPTQTAIDLIGQRGEKTDRVLRLMQGTPFGPVDVPIDASDSGRDGRLIGLEARKDVLVVTRETVRRKKD